VGAIHPSSDHSFLIVSAAQQVYALPLSLVAEIMRPQPLRTLEPAIEGIAGVSRIRGQAMPVIHLGKLAGHAQSEASRFVSMKSGDGAFALAVDSVLGIHKLDRARAQELPALLQVNPGVRATAEFHRELLFYVEPIHLVPADTWEQLKDKTA
jgi:chemotaxis signal transduction protein